MDKFSTLSAMRFSLLIFFTILCLVACKESSDPTLARVENSELKLSEVNGDGRWRTLSEEERNARVEDWISRESVYEKALAEGIEDLPEVRSLIEDAKKKIVLGAYLSKVTDTLSVSEVEVATYYETHPEQFMRNSNVYSVALVTYASATSAWQNYATVAKRQVTAAPEKKWPFRDVEILDSVTAPALDCPAISLENLTVGKFSPPKTCGKLVKSLVVFARIDSGTVKPFAEVSEMARTLAANAKRKDFIAKFKSEIKKRQAIFVYPEEIARSATIDGDTP